MNQEFIVGIVLCVFGLCLLLISPNKIWAVSEKWKTEGGKRPSKTYVAITRLLGIVFLVVGIILLFQ